MAHKPPSILEIHFEGVQIHPEDIPLRALSDALAAVQRLVAGDDGSPDQPTKQGDSLGLVGVRRGSAVYQVSGPQPVQTRNHLRVVGSVLEHPEDVKSGNDYVLSPTKSLSAIGRRLGCEITIREPGSRQDPGAVLARIGPETYQTLSKSLLIIGETSIFGRVERVGGATGPRCGLRVLFQDRLFICKVAGSETVRQLGKWLYKDVAVSGTAQWLKHSFRLFSFTINSASRPEQGSITEAMNALRAASGDAWDLIADPDAYLEEVRRES